MPKLKIAYTPDGFITEYEVDKIPKTLPLPDDKTPLLIGLKNGGMLFLGHVLLASATIIWEPDAKTQKSNTKSKKS